MTNLSYPLFGTPLNCKDHSFFEDAPEIPKEQKSIYIRVFAAEGDIFEGLVFGWAPTRKLILEEIYKSELKLVSFNILAALIMWFQR